MYLHGREGHDPLGVGGVVGVDPPQRPLRLLLDGGECLDGVEELVPLVPVLDVGVDEEAVHLAVDVLHHDLEAVEAPRLGDLNLLHEPLHQVLVHDAVGGREEGQNVGDEIPLVLLQLLIPIFQILKI